MTQTKDAAEPSARSAVDKAISLLSAFGVDGARGVGVSELARRTGLPKSTAFRLLATLQGNGAVERDGNTYRLGRTIRKLAADGDEGRFDRLRDALTPHVSDLYEATHQTVHLAVLQGTEVVYLHKVYGRLHVPSPSRIGGRAPAYCTGVGKVLLAFSPRAADEVLRSELHRLTPSTITDPERLAHELDVIREARIGFDRQEIRPGLSCVAAPVFGPHGRPLAALSLSGHAPRFVPESFVPMLRSAAFEASRSFARGTARAEGLRRSA